MSDEKKQTRICICCNLPDTEGFVRECCNAFVCQDCDEDMALSESRYRCSCNGVTPGNMLAAISHHEARGDNDPRVNGTTYTTTVPMGYPTFTYPTITYTAT